MGETMVTNFVKNERLLSTFTYTPVCITVGGRPLQLLYDGEPASQAKLKVQTVGAEITFILAAGMRQITNVEFSPPNWGTFDAPTSTSVTITSNLASGQSGRVSFTVNGTPTVEATGPEVTNDGNGFCPIGGG